MNDCRRWALLDLVIDIPGVRDGARLEATEGAESANEGTPGARDMLREADRDAGGDKCAFRSTYKSEADEDSPGCVAMVDKFASYSDGARELKVGGCSSLKLIASLCT